MSSVFEKHLSVVKSCKNEAELHSNWFTLLASQYFDISKEEVQHERRGPKGIIDVKLLKGGRCQIAVELKSPEIENLDQHFLQAHQYAFSFNYYRDGKVVHPLGLLTNGKTVIIFDGSLPKGPAYASKEVLDLTKSEDFKKFLRIFSEIQIGHVGHERLHKQPYVDTRPVGLLDEKLQEELRSFLNKITAVVEESVLAFDYWVQLFLIAVLRDHGIVPNTLLNSLEKSGNVRGITIELNRLLNENFIPLNNEWSDLIWEIYGETGRFCTRLNLLHADTLGYAYESVLKIVHGENANSTSVYTPQDLAEEMILKLQPTIEDVILDSASGSGTLLCVAAEIAWSKIPKEQIRIEKLIKFFEDNLVAVDRDIYALKCCKAMLLCTYIKIFDHDPNEYSANWKLPRLKEIYHSNLFDIQINKPISLVVGNPPWGNIDAPNNRVGLRPQDRSLFQNSYRPIYSDDSDVCIYVIRHMLTSNMLVKGKNFRAGFLIKQQVLRNISHVHFRDWAAADNFKFIDHGARQRFPHSPASLVAECFIGVLSENTFVTKINSEVSESNVLNEGMPISDLVISAKGFEPSNKKVYLEIANRIKDSNLKKKWVKSLYPRAPVMVPVIWDSYSANKIMFVPRGMKFPGEISITAQEKKLLKERAQVAAEFPYSWRGCEKLEFYGSNLKNPRIFMPREPARDERVKAGIDLGGTGIGTSGHSVWLKKPEVPLNIFKCLVAWVNSKYFMQQIEVAGINLRAHGFSFEPNEVKKLRVPSWVLSQQTLEWVNSVIEAGTVTQSAWLALDSIPSNSELVALEADIGELMESKRRLEIVGEKIARIKNKKKSAKINSNKKRKSI